MTTFDNMLPARGSEQPHAAVLAAIGVAVSDAMRLLLTRVARENALRFEPLVPNETTIAAIKEARWGCLPRAAACPPRLARRVGTVKRDMCSCCQFLRILRSFRH
ncbi:MAG TPA: type II toxin-antitoxin system RelB/DinJ family antitoxin [Rhizomicrobium sp.]|nr:type II toxin-antitoxin system RelB/DinJ family antitoxin [Rhizomicrobium sp.]